MKKKRGFLTPLFLCKQQKGESMNFKKKIENYQKAGYSLLSVETHEERRILMDIRTMFRNVVTWDFENGLVKDNLKIDKTESPKNALAHITANKEEFVIYVLLDFHRQFKKEPEAALYVRQVRNAINMLKAMQSMIVFVSPCESIPVELQKDVQILDYALPDSAAILNRLEYIVKSVGKDMKDIDSKIVEDVIEAAKGLTFYEIENAFAMAYVSNNGKFDKHYVKRVFEEKIGALKHGGLLEHMNASETFDDVGGYDQLKKWVRLRKTMYSADAKAFGLKYPKGVLLCGVSGAGKSLFAKAIANEFNCPLFKLDVGSLFGSLVGETEAKTRRFIKTVEALGKCVILLDEVEKTFGINATSGAGDSGTSARSFATMLTWLNDRTSPAFIVATCNNHLLLPVELKRKGRFSELFWLDLPDEEERKNICSVVIKKNKGDPTEYSLNKLSKLCDGFVGAEIEAAFEEGMIMAFSDGNDMNEDYFSIALKTIVPHSKAQPEMLDALRKGAKHTLRSAKTMNMTEEFAEKMRKIG